MGPISGSAPDQALAPATDTTVASDVAPRWFAALETKIDYLPPRHVEEIRGAYAFAYRAHDGQTRQNGEPYITHPVAVAALVAEWKLDTSAVIAALLHDVMEDCGVSKADIAARFGDAVAELVDGLTKLDKLHFNTREEGQAESFRKMLLAMARDVRVILVKLADRTHNMRTMGDMPRSKWGRISHETLDIYAPIAHRLGLNATYRELQDLAFRHLKPWRYGVLAKAVERARQRRRDLIDHVKQDVGDALAKADLKARMAGREKSLWSIYEKMSEKGLTFAQVNDLYGMRLIVNNIHDCYLALGVLHQLYKPVPGRFKDYIAIAKVNGYQSLHTTVVGPASINVEFQIRTEAMNLVAEAGIASHWLYKDKGNAADLHVATQWMQSLLDIQDETRDAAEFWDNVKVDLFPDAVYVFTPRGQIMALPRGATVIDFAYAIHSDMGDQTVAAKINGEQTPLRNELANGDVVEIITSAHGTPNPAWLGFVRTGRARSKIRNHIKSLEASQSRTLGEKLLQQALRAEGFRDLPTQDEAGAGLWNQLLHNTAQPSPDALFSDIGHGKLSASLIAKKLSALFAHRGHKADALLLSRSRYTAHEDLSQGAIVVDGSDDLSVKYAKCCHPIPGDGLLGYLASGEGLVVHASNCPVALRLAKRDPEQFVTVAWADEPVRPFNAGIIVTVTNRKGVLGRVADAIAAAEADITHVSMPDADQQQALDLRFLVAVRDRNHLAHLLRTLRWTPAVLRASRTQPNAGALRSARRHVH